MDKKGQNFLEYAIVLGVIAMVLFSMQTYFRRGLQAIIFDVAEDFSDGAVGDIVRLTEREIKEQIYADVAPTLPLESSTVINYDTSGVSLLPDGGRGVIKSSSTRTAEDSFMIGGDYRRVK